MGKVWHPELELLSAIADGELGADEGKYARLHAAGCEECTAQVAAFSRLDTVLAAPFSEELAWEALKRDLAALPSGAPSLRTDLAMAAMVREPQREPARVWQPFPLRGLAIRGAAAAALVLALVIGMIPTAQPEQQQAQAPDPKAAFVAGVQQAVLHTKSNTLYVLKTEEAAVDAVNASTYERRALINVGGRPISLTLNKATDVVLVLDAEAKLLTEIDANQNKVVGSIPLDVEGTPTAVVMNETTGKINVVTSIPNPPSGPRPAPTGTPAPTGAEVAVLDPVTKKLEHLATLEVAPRLVVPHPAGQQTLLVSPDATTVVDALYRPIVSLAGGVSAAFDLKRDWFAVLSAQGAGAKLTFVGDGAPAALDFEGQPAAVIPMPEGGFAVLAAKAQGEGGRIFVIDAAGRLAGITDVGRTGDLDYDARADRFTVASQGTVASVARPGAAVAASPSAPPARASAPASAAPSASPSADPTASDIPNASASPSASVPATPSIAPTADPRVIASLPTDAAGLSTGQYRLELPAAYAPVVTATGAGRVWFVDQRNGLDALDIETGTVYRIAALPGDAEIKALGVGPEYVYAADPVNGRLFLLDLKTEELSDYALPAYDVSAMTITPGGVAWISVPGSPQLLSFTPLSKRLQAVDIRTSGIVALEADGRGRIWFSTGNGLGYYEPAARLVTNLAWTAGQINELLAGPRDALWVATASGLIYSVKDGSTIAPAALVGRPVTALTLDARGKPWYVAPASGGAAFRAVSGGQERSVSGPAVGLALNSQGRAWLFDPQGGFVLELGAAR